MELRYREDTFVAVYKHSEEMVTVLACSNSNGNHRLRLMCVVKSAKSRAFRKIAVNALPVYYKHQDAMMNSFHFKEWFFDEFVPTVETFYKKTPSQEKLYY